MHNVVKWPNILLKSYGVNTARFLKYIWLFYIMDERVKTTKRFERPLFLTADTTALYDHLLNFSSSFTFLL